MNVHFNTERLIDAVKDYPCLYDHNDRHYKTQLIKSNVWDEIAAKLELRSGEVARSKWRNIRDSYVKYLKAMSSRQGKLYKNYVKWPWTKQMQFLRPHVPGRSRTTAPTNIRPYEPLVSIKTEIAESPGDHQSPDLVYEEEEPPGAEMNFLEQSASNSSFAEPQRTFEDYVQAVRQAPIIQDATELLFLSYAKTLKTFSINRQMTTKMAITNLMMAAEMEEISEGKQTNNS